VQSKDHLILNAKAHKERIKKYDEIIRNIEITKVYSDALSPIFSELIFWTSPYLTLATYENVKTDKGIDIISNDSLKHKIIYLHEYHLKLFIGDTEREEWNHTETITRPAMFKYLILPRDTMLYRKTMKPLFPICNF
jgi:hypothetical protein